MVEGDGISLCSSDPFGTSTLAQDTTGRTLSTWHRVIGGGCPTAGGIGSIALSGLQGLLDQMLFQMFQGGGQGHLHQPIETHEVQDGCRLLL